MAQAGGISAGAGVLCDGVGTPPLERIAMKLAQGVCWMVVLFVAHLALAQTNGQRTLVLVIGAAGEPEYAGAVFCGG